MEMSASWLVLNISVDVIQPILWRAESARAAVARHAAS